MSGRRLVRWLIGHVEVEWLWEPRDIWLGVFLHPLRLDRRETFWNVYVCVVPMLPIAFRWHSWASAPPTSSGDERR